MLAGAWHLVPLDSPEGELPPHRVDLVFHDDEKGLRGAVLSRDGKEVPLESVAFDGSELRLRMAKHPNAPPRELPFVVMAKVDDHFEGQWDAPAVRHIRLKLVRARG